MLDKLSHFFLRRRNWTLPYALFLLIFAIVPLLLIVLYAFTDADGAFTFANFRKFMMHPEAMNTFIYSIGIALITTLTCLLLGYPAAYILSQKQFNTSQTMVVLFILPMWVNILIHNIKYSLNKGGRKNGIYRRFIQCGKIKIRKRYEQLQRRIFKRKQQVFVNERFRAYAQSEK